MKEQLAVGFVMMPFRNGANRFWKTIQEVAERFKYLSIERFGSQGLTRGGELFSAVRKGIQQADFALADFTRDEMEVPNANVITEAGIALGADKPLYVVAREASYVRLKKSLPSDWSGHYIELFPPNQPKQWHGLLHDLFEKILHDLDRPATLSPESPRSSDAEQLRWILRLVAKLRVQCREVYDRPDSGIKWSSRRRPWGNGLPNTYTFPLVSERAPNIKVLVGAFFERWDRDGIPLGVLVQDEQNGQPTWFPIDVASDRALLEITTDDAIREFISTLDKVLHEYTPELAKPTSLARRLQEWENYAPILSDVCEELGLIKTAGKCWSEDGYLLQADIPATKLSLTIGIDFEHWAERSITPCWIRIEPRDGESPEILTNLRLPYLRSLSEPGYTLVPVPMDGNFGDNLRKRLQKVKTACEKASRTVIEEPEDGDACDIPPGTFPDGPDEEDDSDVGGNSTTETL